MTADLARLAREALDQIGTFPDADMLRTGHAHSRADAAYIAAASPDVVLALLARVEALETVARDAKAQIEYLHEKLCHETGSGNAVLARLSAALGEPTP